MSYDTVLATEAEWYALDLSAQGVPPLAKEDGGRFDIVATHARRLNQVRAQLYLTHGPTREGKGAKSMVRLDHEVVAIVLLGALGAGARENVDQVSVEELVADVVARVMGPPGDVDHAGRWFKVGPVSAEPASVLDRLRWADAITAAGAAHVVPVRYTVSEFDAR